MPRSIAPATLALVFAANCPRKHWSCHNILCDIKAAGSCYLYSVSNCTRHDLLTDYRVLSPICRMPCNSIVLYASSPRSTATLVSRISGGAIYIVRDVYTRRQIHAGVSPASLHEPKDSDSHTAESCSRPLAVLLLHRTAPAILLSTPSQLIPSNRTRRHLRSKC